MALQSAHELRAILRKARIDRDILKKRVEALEACLRGEHQFPSKGTTCFVCKNSI